MIRQIAPVFFTLDIPATLAFYKDKLGFECLGTWQDPPVYAIVARDQQPIHFRCAEPPTANADKYADGLCCSFVLWTFQGVTCQRAGRANWRAFGTVGEKGGMCIEQTVVMAGKLIADRFRTPVPCGF